MHSKPKELSVSRVLLRNMLNRLLVGKGAPRYAERIYVDPRTVQAITMKHKHPVGWDRTSSGRIVRNWPTDLVVPITEHEKIRYCLLHWNTGLSWEESGAYEWYTNAGAGKSARLPDRLKLLDAVFQQVAREGRLRSVRDLKGSAYLEERGVRINIGPSGELVFVDGGSHRLAIAIALGLAKIPAQLGVVHREFADKLSVYRELHVPRE